MTSWAELCIRPDSLSGANIKSVIKHESYDGYQRLTAQPSAPDTLTCDEGTILCGYWSVDHLKTFVSACNEKLMPCMACRLPEHTVLIA